jgi:hypothetical protein
MPSPFSENIYTIPEELDSYPDFTPFTLSCAKCASVVYFSLLVTGSGIMKIGQYPSFASEEAAKVKKYKNIIPKYYEELTRSLNSYSQGMNIGAFVYLRRIYEHLIESRYSGNDNTKFIDKLKAVEAEEKIIPEDLTEVKNQLYEVLSKGVHEYTENDCGRMYPFLRFCIEAILDEELAKKERKEKANNAKKAISAVLAKKGNPT